MVEKKKPRNPIRDISFRVAKAAIAAILIYVLYLLLLSLLAPLFEFIPWLAGTIEVFVIVFIVLMILGDLTKGTIFQHFFNVARSLFVIGYLLVSMGNGKIGVSYENFSLTLDLTIFYGFAVVLGLLSLAKSILQAINYLNERAEITEGLVQI
jgi:uncharacterized ion transporter superfamily protein YfcC